MTAGCAAGIASGEVVGSGIVASLLIRGRAIWLGRSEPKFVGLSKLLVFPRAGSEAWIAKAWHLRRAG